MKAERVGWAVAVVVALVAGGSVAYAAIPHSTSGKITACYATSGTQKGVLRVIDPQAGQLCASGEKTLEWASRGVRWRGGWNTTAAYSRDDVVAYRGASYIAKADVTGTAPPSPTYWATFSQASASFPLFAAMTFRYTKSGCPAPAMRLEVVRTWGQPIQVGDPACHYPTEYFDASTWQITSKHTLSTPTTTGDLVFASPKQFDNLSISPIWTIGPGGVTDPRWSSVPAKTYFACNQGSVNDDDFAWEPVGVTCWLHGQSSTWSQLTQTPESQPIVIAQLPR